MPAISNKVVMVAVYPDLTKKQLDGDMVMRRVNEFVEAVRQDAIIIIDRKTSTRWCVCADLRRCNCKRTDKPYECEKLLCEPCKAIARVDPDEYCRKLTDIYERHTKRIQMLEANFKRFYSMSALHEEFATATKRPVSMFRKIWRRRQDCPNDCRGLLHLWCGHKRSWTTLPSLENFLQYKLMHQGLEADKVWKQFKDELIRSRIFEGIYMDLPPIVSQEGLAISADNAVTAQLRETMSVDGPESGDEATTSEEDNSRI
ncbi:hypothetical protein jhhlp_007854 [Lomentospora prolificans]|uniref:Uncharacterized protein n=1 Tax=Lomentospora prolificans TaxID=41688 RepID=A0A2N3N0R5_9PEZI|nr:hypothetical protein jhhlp_007854 [Lomentospora prolificans]